MRTMCSLPAARTAAAEKSPGTSFAADHCGAGGGAGPVSGYSRAASGQAAGTFHGSRDRIRLPVHPSADGSGRAGDAPVRGLVQGRRLAGAGIGGGDGGSPGGGMDCPSAAGSGGRFAVGKHTIGGRAP